MQRELTYHVPLARLRRLSRSAARKAYPSVRLLTWVVVVLFALLVSGVVVYGNKLRGWLEDDLGIPFGLELLFIGAALAFLASILLLRRHQISLIKRRADFDHPVRMTQDNGGLRFATPGIEYYVKWPGVSQLLLEHDGVVVSCGNLFFLVPDRAFAGATDRLAFIRDVYGRLSENARKISERHVRSALTAKLEPAADQ
jgi:hypothetical protein